MKKDKYFIFRERPHVLSPAYWNMVYQTWQKTKKVHGIAINVEWGHFKNGRQKMFLLKTEWDKKSKYMLKNLLDKNYFNRVDNNVKKETEKVKKFLKKSRDKELSKVSFDDLIKLANETKELCLNYDTANVLPWLLGADKFQDYLFKKLNISQEDFNLIITPKEKTAVSQLEEKLITYSKEIKERKKDLNEAAEKLAKDFGWIPFGYDGPEYWDKTYFVKKLSNKLDKENFKINNNKRLKILSKLNNRELELVKRANALALWTDKRKKYTFQLYYFYSEILHELEKRYNVPYENLKHLFTEELSKLDKKVNKLIEISNKRMNNDFIIEVKNGFVRVVSDKKKSNILKELKNQIKEKQKVRGMVACRGLNSVYRGRVKVILSPKEANKIKSGNFLVATMTSPDYILAMKKAVGFITDEGGVTCHAAIVAREMNKPCIIGTKIATKILKDGDLVEIDTNKGIVKVVKRGK